MEYKTFIKLSLYMFIITYSSNSKMRGEIMKGVHVFKNMLDWG